MALNPATAATILRSKGTAGYYRHKPPTLQAAKKLGVLPGITPGYPQKAAPTTGAPGAAAAGAPAQAPRPTAWDATTDPLLQGLQSQQTQDLNTLAAQNLANKKRVLLGFGSQELARKMLGDDPFVGLVSNNPDTSSSTLAQSAYAYRKGVQGFNESENEGNLFYGGGRGVGLRDMAHANLIDIANQTQGVEQQLSGYDESFSAAQRAAAQNYWNAAMQQYGNFLGSANLR